MVRDENGIILDPDDTSVITLFRSHEIASRRIDERIQEEKVEFLASYSKGHFYRSLLLTQLLVSILSQSQLQPLDICTPAMLHVAHTYTLYVNLKNFVCNMAEDAELLMCLYDPDISHFIR